MYDPDRLTIAPGEQAALDQIDAALHHAARLAHDVALPRPPHTRPLARLRHQRRLTAARLILARGIEQLKAAATGAEHGGPFLKAAVAYAEMAEYLDLDITEALRDEALTDGEGA